MQQNQNKTMLRLNKALSRAGICSRRRAEELIRLGQIQVNQETVQDLGRKIDPSRDRVQIQGKDLDLAGREQTRHLHLALHKPTGVVCTLRDPQGRSCIPDLLPAWLKQYRLLPAGRLDCMSEGLLILSTDGGLIQKVTHPSHQISKTYQVLIQEEVTWEQLQTMRQGMQLQEGQTLAPVQVRILGPEPKKGIWLELVLTQGLNRQIRRMCRDLGLTVLRLIRTRQGPVHLHNLPPGQTRPLSSKELARLQGPSKKGG
ncbi:MAG: pseudouridine synthase [Thermodesulfobacteriota bacterium]